MCGIVGIVDFGGRPVDGDLLRRMGSAVRHRGPDEEGFYLSGEASRQTAVGLGVRRLSIIDLVGGQQPVANEDGTVWVIQNGEIYNFLELRQELEARGHRFRSRSDTEVIVHAYEEYGDECASRLHGMFAFAVWDDTRQRLLLARDRLGKKPLVYAEQAGRLSFASEIRPLLLDPGLSREMDLQALDAYLTYLAIPAPFTIYQRVRKLPPGHVLAFENGITRLRRYWDLAFLPKFDCSEEEAAGRLEELLTDAVRRRLISDVPLGAFLSGGVDSSVVTALMARLLDRPVKTFSIGFEEPEYNELPTAGALARTFGFDHHEFVVKPKAAEVLPTLVEHFGEPFADSSAIPTYYLSQLARQHVTVALTGDGGDELFAGYGRHLANRLAERWQRLPEPLRALAVGTVRTAVSASADPRGRPARLRRFLESADLSRPERYEHWAGYFSGDLRTTLYAHGHATGDTGTVPELFARVEPLDAVDAMLAVDTTFYLPTDLLVKMDITSMANSLETRSPLLDHRLVEFAARLPSEMKLKGLTSKYLVKRLFKGIVPARNLTGRKRGFAVPISRWFRGELREFLSDHLLNPRFTQRGLFDASRVEALVRDHLDGRTDYAHHLWALLMLELWHRS